MEYKYKTHGVCSREIDIELNDDDTIKDISFLGGCNLLKPDVKKLHCRFNACKRQKN